MLEGQALQGQGLHGGRPSRISFSRAGGRTRVTQNGREATLAELHAGEGARATIVQSESGVCVGTVEHLFSALAAEGMHDGLAIAIDGDEVPLLDGGARAFVDALRRVGVSKTPPRVRIAKPASFTIADAEYVFAPMDDVRVSVEVDFGDARLEREATWAGDAEDFRIRIAPARTFGFSREIEALLRSGLASHVSPESVVVLADDCILHAGAPFRPDEPARHKLLDLIGDAFLYGGPPIGSLKARRPGHAATHEAMKRAIASGVLVPR